MADLAQVHRGEGVAEYRDPVEFFARRALSLMILARTSANA